MGATFLFHNNSCIIYVENTSCFPQQTLDATNFPFSPIFLFFPLLFSRRAGRQAGGRAGGGRLALAFAKGSFLFAEEGMEKVSLLSLYFFSPAPYVS